jgi:N6-adenosine-specific RNA methylase IME4
MKKYDVIVADPPWHFNDGLEKMKTPVRRSAQSQYATLSLNEIQRLNIKDLANPTGCMLALWVPSSMLEAGLETMRRWGFSLKQTFIWVKLKKDYALEEDWNQATRFGMGRLFRQAHEIALIGTCGKSVYPKLKNNSQRSVAFDLNKGHSIKPETLQDRLDEMFPSCEKLEIFARRIRPGWTCIGDGVTGMDVRDSIEHLITPPDLIEA